MSKRTSERLKSKLEPPAKKQKLETYTKKTANKLTVVKLKDILKNYDVQPKGRKSELVDKLLQAQIDNGCEIPEEEEEEEVIVQKKAKKKTRAVPPVSTGSSRYDLGFVDSTPYDGEPIELYGEKDGNDHDYSLPPIEEEDFKVISWNVAGFNSVMGKGFVEYVKKERAHVYCLQETKITQANVEKKFKSQLKNIGYDYTFFECENKNGYAGTGIFYRVPPVSIKKGMGIEEHDSEGRTLTIEYENFYIVTTYVPNSGTGKKKLHRLEYRTQEWDVDLFNYLNTLNKTKPIVWCGDLNVAVQPMDLKNPKSNKRNAGFTIEERTSFTNFLDSGYVDTFRHFEPDTRGVYTFWSYFRGARGKNIGWRLDYFITCEKYLQNIKHSYVRRYVMGSDHCPIGLIIKNTPRETNPEEENSESNNNNNQEITTMH